MNENMNPIDSKTLDELDKYLNGKLTDVEKETLESRINTEPVLNEWLNWLKETSIGMENVAIGENKDLVKEWLAVDKKAADSSKNILNKIIAFILILSLVLLAAYFIFHNKGAEEKSVIQIAQVHLVTPYKSPTVLRNKDMDNWQKSIQYYSNKDYNAFLEANSNLINEGIANNEQKLYFAMSNLYKKPPNYTMANQYFTELLTIKSGYEEIALWYRSLSYLTMGENSRAKDDLEMLINRSNFKNEEALELLDTL